MSLEARDTPAHGRSAGACRVHRYTSYQDRLLRGVGERRISAASRLPPSRQRTHTWSGALSASAIRPCSGHQCGRRAPRDSTPTLSELAPVALVRVLRASGRSPSRSQHRKGRHTLKASFSCAGYSRILSQPFRHRSASSQSYGPVEPIESPVRCT